MVTVIRLIFQTFCQTNGNIDTILMVPSLELWNAPVMYSTNDKTLNASIYQDISFSEAVTTQA